MCKLTGKQFRVGRRGCCSATLSVRLYLPVCFFQSVSDYLPLSVIVRLFSCLFLNEILYLRFYLCTLSNTKFYFSRLVKGYQKIDKFSNVISYFCLREWHFKNDNIQALWERMKRQDMELFEFSMKRLNWDLFFYTYTRGARLYLLKDPLNTIDKGAAKIRKLKIAHYSVMAILAYAFFKLVMLVLSLFIRF